MAGTANYAGIVKWAQLDLQRIQHRDYVGHLSIYNRAEILKIIALLFGRNDVFIKQFRFLLTLDTFVNTSVLKDSNFRLPQNNSIEPCYQNSATKNLKHEFLQEILLIMVLGLTTFYALQRLSQELIGIKLGKAVEGLGTI